MIRDIHGKRTTPKRLAQWLIMDHLSLVQGYWREQYSGIITNDMTEREKLLVEEQLKKVSDRIARSFGYDESWSG
jgi:hypothetical protein